MVSLIIVVYRLRILHFAASSLTALEDEGEFPNIAQVETPVQTPAGPSRLTVSDLPESDDIDIVSPLGKRARRSHRNK
jgi:hypothetical protein